MLNKSFLLSLVATTMLAGCSLTPDYNRPAAPVSTQWPQGPAYAPLAETGEMKVSQISWRDFFISPQLQHIIQTTLDNNRDLRVAALNIEAARATYRVQRADLVPGIAATGTGNRQGIPEDISPTGRDATTSQYSANVGTTAFELDFFGRVRSLNESALEKYFATQEAYDSAQISLIAEVANAYLTYQADRKLLALTNDTLAAQQESYDVIKKSFDMGVGTALDVAQIETSLQTARANQAIYMRRVAQDKNALTLLMGASVDDSILEAEGLDSVEIMQDLPVGLSSSVLLDRPDIRQAEHALKAANADIGAARAAFFPMISLTASAGVASTSLADLFSSGAGLAWSFIPQITLPIFEGGRNRANLDGAKANEKIAVAQYEKSIQAAFREVADELAARGTYTNQLESQNALVAATQKSYDLSQARYKAGIDSHLSVLDSQRALYQAQQNQITVQQQRLSNLITLYKALGGGVDAR
jgi:multidrug efflux system outer membrane protein